MKNSMCLACTNDKKQSYLIEKAISRQDLHESREIDVDLVSFKKSILNRLEYENTLL